MSKKLILILLSVVMFSTVIYAQKVIKNGDAVIIDCSNMNPKYYSSKKIEPRTTTATNDSGPTSGYADISSLTSNAKVYKKFEVHGADNSAITDWKGAVTLCASLSTDGGGWRIPTLRELMLMWILKEKLIANSVKPFSANSYWSATQTRYDVDGVTCVNFKYGYAANTPKPANNHNITVRCIRDID